MGRLFGTDGIRGIALDELTPKIGFGLGLAVAHAAVKSGSGKSNVIIGKDTRESGDMFECAIAAGLCAGGCDAYFLGVVPTPAVAYLVRETGAAAGVMISASHNPSEYNGLKVFGPLGYKLDDELEAEAEKIILGESDALSFGRIGRTHDAHDKIKLYEDHVISVLREAKIADPGKRKILFDLSNGSASATAKTIFAGENIFGFDADFVSDTPDGKNINAHCGSTHIEELADKVRAGGYDLAAAFDGDADRCLLLDENGHLIDGDMIIARLALEMKQNGALKENAAVVTKLTNLGFHKMAKKNGISVHVTDVGDRYVLEDMVKTGACIGGEQSGHIILSDYATTGDGQITASKAIELLALCKGEKASEIFGAMTVLPQVSLNVKVSNDVKKRVGEIPEVAREVERIAEILGDGGRILLRPSGTEALVRIMLEGEDKAELENYAHGLEKIILACVG